MYISAYFIYVSELWYFSVHTSIEGNQSGVVLMVFGIWDKLGTFRFSVVFGCFRYSVGPDLLKENNTVIRKKC